jgi:hypothetical protein
MNFWLEAKKTGSPGGRLKHDLPDPHTGRVGPYTLKAWAIREGLDIHYIDNCYLKVAVQREQLHSYFSELYGLEEPFPTALLSVFGPEWEFVLAAEEF